jgi:hypothetical protein
MTFRAERSRLAPDPRLRVSIIAVALCGTALTLGTLGTLGPRAALSAAVGAAIATANLWLLARMVGALLRADSDQHPPGIRGRPAWAWPLVVLKMFGLFALIWVLMRYSIVSPLAMMLGFGALPVGIVIGALLSDRPAPG